MKKTLIQLALLLATAITLGCSDPKTSSGGGGGGGGGAGSVNVTAAVDESIVLNIYGESVSLCSDSTNIRSYERLEHIGVGLLNLKALLCVEEEVKVTVCPTYSRNSIFTQLQGDSDDYSEEDSGENSGEAIECPVITKENISEQFSTTDNSQETFFNFMNLSVVAINDDFEDVGSQVLVRYDQSILNDTELSYLMGESGSREYRRTSYTVYESDSLLYEDMAFWTYDFQNSRLVDYVSVVKEVTILNVIGVTQLSKFIIDKRYEALELFAHSSNVNDYSRDQVPVGKNNITTYGLSPLMVAAVLADDKAIEILKAVDGIDLNYLSPMLGGSYTGIINGTYSYSHITGAQSGWASGSGAWGGNGGGSPGAGSPSGGGGGGGGGGSPSGNATSPPQTPRSDCEDCTAVMVAVKNNTCSSIQTIVDGEPSEANALNERGHSAIDFARLFTPSRCLSAVLASGTDPRLGGNFLHEAIVEAWPGNLIDVPEEYWEGFDLEDKEAYLLSVLQMKDDSSMNDVGKIVVDFAQISPSEAQEILTDNYSALQNATNTGFHALKAMDVDLNAVKDDAGLTIFDHSLRKRVETTPIFGESETPFKNMITKFIGINNKWLEDWLNGQSFYGYNPLVLSVMYKERRVLNEMLRVRGTDLSLVDQKTGYSALDWAYVHVDILDWDINGDPEDGFTRFSFGKRIVRLLQRNGAVLSVDSVTVIKELQPSLRQKFVEINNEFRQFNEDSENPTPFENVMNWTRTRD